MGSPFGLKFRIVSLNLHEESGIPGSYQVTLQEFDDRPADGYSLKSVGSSPPNTRVEHVSRARFLDLAVGDEFELALTPQLLKVEQGSYAAAMSKTAR